MILLLSISTYLLDMLIITIFLNNFFEKKEGFSQGKYLAALILVEVALCVNEYFLKTHDFSYAKVLTVAISVITTFFLCLFFESSFLAKVLATCLFQIFVSVGEIAFTYAVSKINPNFLTTADKSILYNTMNSGSKFVLLILCICVSFISKKGSGIHTVGHNIMLLSTPIITLCIFCVVPIKNFYKDDSNFFDALFVCLAALNVVNFVLINRSLSFDDMKFKNAQMEQQLFFQKEKYNQLSEAYRQNRRIIHDVKKHYFSIGEYINHNDLKGLLEYTNTAAKDLEATYVKYNTGNLVIDSFLTNYSNLFSANHIEFVARLNVECARVPVNDYDLCIILGNILDNAFNACKKAESFENNFLIEIETTNNDKFRIHTENAMPKVEESTENLKKSSINHGFGLENIKKTVKENNGFVTISTDEVFILDILIPIMDESMRVSKAN